MAAAVAKTATGQGFHEAVTAPILGGIASGVMNPTTSKPGAKPGAAPKTSAKSGAAKPSTAEPPTGEIEIETKLPLIAAITALGGVDVLLAAKDLQLVTTKFPKAKGNIPSSENKFVQGLEGKVAAAVRTSIPNGKKPPIPLALAAGDSFRIRWDFVPGEPGTEASKRSSSTPAAAGATVGLPTTKTPTKGSPSITSNPPTKPTTTPPSKPPTSSTPTTSPLAGKGLHINTEFFSTANGTKRTLKIAFLPSGVGPVVDPATARNPDRFDQIVRDQSSFLEYNTKPNTLQKVFSLEERVSTGPGAPGTKAEVERMAKRLAERWAEIVKSGAEGELTEAIKPKGAPAAAAAAPTAGKTGQVGGVGGAAASKLGGRGGAPTVGPGPAEAAPNLGAPGGADGSAHPAAAKLGGGGRSG